jgi:hypothetical protein
MPAHTVVELPVLEAGAKAMAELAIMAVTAAVKVFMVNFKSIPKR